LRAARRPCRSCLRNAPETNRVAYAASREDLEVVGRRHVAHAAPATTSPHAARGRPDAYAVAQRRGVRARQRRAMMQERDSSHRLLMACLHRAPAPFRHPARGAERRDVARCLYASRRAILLSTPPYRAAPATRDAAPRGGAAASTMPPRTPAECGVRDRCCSAAINALLISAPGVFPSIVYRSPLFPSVRHQTIRTATLIFQPAFKRRAKAASPAVCSRRVQRRR